MSETTRKQNLMDRLMQSLQGKKTAPEYSDAVHDTVGPEAKKTGEEKPVTKKRTLLISQPHGIGDILFIQKIILHYANQGFHVVVPIADRLSWIRYYLEQHPDIEYPLISTKSVEWTGNFKFADVFFAMHKASSAVHDSNNQIYKTPVVCKGDDEISSPIFLALGASYVWNHDKIMPAKYNFVGLDFYDWADHVHLKRRMHVERELYYDVLGLTDDSRYTLVNQNSSNNVVAISVPGKTVSLREIDGFTLFDWSLVIEKASQIVTIDTSLVLLTEILKQRKPLYVISRYDPPTFENIEDILSLDWNFVLTSRDLDVEAAA